MELTSKEIRDKLSSDFARSAFDKLDRLQPAWTMQDLGADGKYLSPDIRVIHKDGAWVSIGGGRAESYDESVTAAWQKLVRELTWDASRKLVVNAYQTGREEKVYGFNLADETFAPLPPLPPRKWR